MPNLNLILGVVGVIAILALGIKIYNTGYDKCEADNKAAAVELENQSNSEIEDIREETEERIRNVYEAPDSDDGPIAPVLQRVIDGMYERNPPDSE